MMRTAAFFLAIVCFTAAAIVGCTGHTIPQSQDARPAITAAQGDVASQNTILQQQVEALTKALAAATAAGSDIEKAKGQGAQARAAGAANPAVVDPLDAQAKTLTSAGTNNAETLNQLHAAQDENGQLKAKNEELSTKLQSAIDIDTAGETEKAALRADNAKLKKDLEDGRNATLLHYFGWSLAALILGIAGAIWIPAPAKTAGYILATVGAAGVCITIFLIVWMKIFVWVLLAAFVIVGAIAAYAAWKNHGALTKTSQGVEGMKQDLQALATSHPVEAVRTAAGTVLSDWFGAAESDIKGVFHWLHSEYSALIARIRTAIGSKPAITPNLTTPVNSPGNVSPGAVTPAPAAP